jgi:ribosomal peptide maturation radical SAM protein 1
MSEPLRVALLVMPFASCDRPSLAVGLLKAALTRVEIDCEVKHFNLTFWKLLGHARYQQMSQSPSNTSMVGEWVFSQVFYGQAVSSWDRYEREVLDHPQWGLSREHRPLVRETLALAPMFLRLAFESNDWSRYDLIGFTSTFEQTMASLCLARMIRAAHPRVRIALGGANFEASMGGPYLEQFDFVDYVSIGEADRNFPMLCRRLADARARGIDDDEIELPAGMLGRARARSRMPILGRDPVVAERPELIEDLDELPIPDYTEYFEIADAMTRGQPVRAGEPTAPWLTLETSRGCWWGRKSHCTFCGLNGETMGFRRKQAPRVLAEIRELVDRYGPHPLQFTDNILSHDYFADLLPEWAADEQPMHKFFEIKANLRRSQVELLARAGIVQVQPGIESLDDATLDEMGKGVSAAQNIALMRWCAELGVRAYWNILYGFPHEPADSYARQLDLMRHLVHLPAPTACALIRLDRFSPNYNDWQARGFTSIAPLPAYRHLFPFDDETLARLAYFFVYDHPQLAAAVEGGANMVRFVRRWRDVRAREEGGRLQVTAGEGGFSLIDDRLEHRGDHRSLSAVELAVLLACDRPAKPTLVLERARAVGPGAEDALGRLTADSVIAELGGTLICLALLPSPEQLRAANPDLPSWLHRAN